ncbi:MAG: HNH endonuclease [Sulfuricella sp.]|nr:HNH endonuclease [Sulfuricella sp.]
MRPVRRGKSPQAMDFDPYDAAKPFLISRLGSYCSYCERRIATQLAVEHIQPKGLPAYSHLIGRWDNYLLACVNCNSTKKDKDVVLADVLLPDRDNTFAAFEYRQDGSIVPSAEAKAAGVEKAARHTLSLTGLDKKISVALDENGKQIAIDRVKQRLDVWAIAEDAKQDVDTNPGNDALLRSVVSAAKGHGFFSIWLAVFRDNVEMCNRLIDAFEGTRDSLCFAPDSALPVSPAPNLDHLPEGGKI